MNKSNLFGVFNTVNMVDSNNNYVGHVSLAESYEQRKLEFEKYFDSLPGDELKYTVKVSFFKYFDQQYYVCQMNVAEHFLRGKVVRVDGGIVIENANPRVMNVRSVCSPDSFYSKKDPGILVELCYGEDSLGKILIKKDTKINILRDIKKE